METTINTSVSTSVDPTVDSFLEMIQVWTKDQTDKKSQILQDFHKNLEDMSMKQISLKIQHERDMQDHYCIEKGRDTAKELMEVLKEILQPPGQEIFFDEDSRIGKWFECFHREPLFRVEERARKKNTPFTAEFITFVKRNTTFQLKTANHNLTGKIIDGRDEIEYDSNEYPGIEDTPSAIAYDQDEWDGSEASADPSKPIIINTRSMGNKEFKGIATYHVFLISPRQLVNP